MQVSLITCTNNSEKTIQKCCQSVYSQTYNNIEHIIVDKNSQDKTISIIKQYKLKNIKIYNQKGFGIYNALNKGMKLCNGKIIGILHSDDEFIDQEIISEIVSKFHEKNFDILFSNIYYTKKNDIDKIIRKWKSNLKEGVQSNKELNSLINTGWMPPHPGIFLKKDLLNEIGNYDENFKISSDYDFIIRLFRNQKIKFYYLDKFTIKMRSGGISNKNLKNILLKMREDFEIMKRYNLNPIKTILLKNLSKIKQFFT